MCVSACVCVRVRACEDVLWDRFLCQQVWPHATNPLSQIFQNLEIWLTDWPHATNFGALSPNKETNVASTLLVAFAFFWTGVNLESSTACPHRHSGNTASLQRWLWLAIHHSSQCFFFSDFGQEYIHNLHIDIQLSCSRSDSNMLISVAGRTNRLSNSAPTIYTIQDLLAWNFTIHMSSNLMSSV
jgi:hypothetical protein